MKPDFLTTPEAWTRAARQSVDPVAHACAIESHRPSGSWKSAVLTAVICLAGCVCIGWLAAQAF
jgi:hypothetical protein